MAFREIKPTAVPANENLYEPEQPTTVSRAVPWSFTFPRVTGFSFAFPHALIFKNISLGLLAQFIGAVLILLLGISFAGSFYGAPASKFGGIFATIIYQWQLGNLLIILGSILGYDATRKLFQ